MKKVLMIAAIAVMIFGCSKEEESTEQTFFVNVYTQYSESSEEQIASPCHVFLFEDKGKTIDKDESYYSAYRDGVITYTDETTERYVHKSPTTSGINNFENIPNGKYILFVAYISYGYVAAASHKQIIVNKDYNMTIEKKVFLYRGSSSAENYGYQEWDEKW
jgi:hypothetical protein